MRALRSAVRCGVPRAAAAVGGVGVPRVQGGGAARSLVAAAGEAFREGFRQYSSSRSLRFRATPGACGTGVSESEYIEIAENTFLDLEDKLEILENHVDGFDMTYSDGVMTMDLQDVFLKPILAFDRILLEKHVVRWRPVILAAPSRE